MSKRKIRTISLICIIFIVAVSLTGCSIVPTLNLTEEQSNLIAEYAAGKLIEYVKGHPGGLMKVEDIDRADVNPGMKKEEEQPSELPPLHSDGGPAPEQEALPEAPEAIADQPVDVPADQEALVDVPAEVESVPTQTIAQALGIEGAEVTYDHYEITSTYP